MAIGESWGYQGRQQHGWFGNGTAPKEIKSTVARAPDGLLDAASIGQRITTRRSASSAALPGKSATRWPVHLTSQGAIG